MDEYQKARLENQIENTLEVHNVGDVEAVALLCSLAAMYAKRAAQLGNARQIVTEHTERQSQFTAQELAEAEAAWHNEGGA